MLINEKYEVNIYLNDINLSTMPITQINSVDIYEDIYNGLPQISLQLSVPNMLLNQNVFVDGTKITVTIKSEDLQLEGTYNFRCWNINKIKQNDDTLEVNLNGILDVYNIYTDGNTYNNFGNTSDIFKQIAKQNNWDSDIDPTNDRQLWVAGKRNLFQFMHHLCKYGWCSDTSAMMWFFDKNKQLLYKDFSALLKQKSDNIYMFKRATIGSAEEKYFAYTDFDIQLTAGTDNVVNGGYGNDFDVFNLLEYKNKNIHANKVIAESAVINISKELSHGLNYDWFSIDVGNFHENYHIAYAQNKRIRATYSTYINLNCSYFQKFRLGEIVDLELRCNSADNNQNQMFSMLGMIAQIHTKITTESVTAQVQVVSQGVNTRSTQVETY